MITRRQLRSQLLNGRDPNLLGTWMLLPVGSNPAHTTGPLTLVALYHGRLGDVVDHIIANDFRKARRWGSGTSLHPANITTVEGPPCRHLS